MGSTIRSRGKKDYTNIFALNMVITNTKKKGIITLIIPIIIRKINKRLRLPNLINIIKKRKVKALASLIYYIILGQQN